MKRLQMQFLSGAGIFVFSLFVANICNFLFNAYLGRMLSFDEFGLITLVTTIWNLSTVLFGSLGAVVNYKSAYLSTHDSKYKAYDFYRFVEKKTLMFISISSFLWALSVPFFATYFSVPPIVLWMVTPAFVAGAMSFAARGYFSGMMLFTYAGILVLVESGIKLLMGILLVYFKLPALVYLSVPLSIIAAFVISQAILFFIGYKLRSEKRSDTYRFPRRFFVAGIVAGAATTAFLSLDVIMAKHFLSTTLAGEYAFLSLVGKMVYFFGSLLNSFVITFVSRDEGAGRDTNRTFFRFLIATVFLTLISYLGVGVFGTITLPILFGAKALTIAPFLPPYALAIALYTITGYIVLFHLARKHYLFSLVALIMAGCVAIGISLSHDSIAAITHVLLLVSIINFFVTALLHFLQRNGEFVLRNLIDLMDIFSFTQKNDTPRGTLRILVFNWRDMRHLFAGGAEVYIHELSKRWVAQGHQVTVFCGNDSKSPRNEVIDGVNVVRRGGFYFVYFWAFFYYVLKFRGKFDIVVDCQNGIPFFTPLYVKEKVVCVVHHIHQEVFRTNLSLPFALLAEVLENRVMPLVYRNVRFITVSPSTKKEMETLSMEGVGISIVHNGINPQLYKPGKKSLVPMVLYVGRLKYYKTLNVFIKAAAIIHKKVPSARFVIAGDGEEKAGLTKLVEKLGLEHAVLFTGYITEAKKVQLYQESWVFVNPSLMEGWGITTLEANACGTPVVASDVPGLRDSVKHEESGFLIPHGESGQFAEAVIRLLTDTSLRSRMGVSAREWAKRFEWDKSAKQFMTILLDDAPVSAQKKQSVVLTPIQIL